ncbi:RINT1-like protein [Folsomia candida]|uniref:RINT1-like protein n=1 Tax=Folsomia candida TaxID=158441 RepID=A0A226DKB4_FOLCA|nr:RINT1-like protein [Folsomia candida]
MASTKPSTTPNILATLVTKSVWKSEELADLLAQEVGRRDKLQELKIAAEKEAARLKMEGNCDLQEEVEYLQSSFNKVKVLVTRMAKEKLPNRWENLEFYQNVAKVEELEKCKRYMMVLDFYTTTSEKIGDNMESDLEMDAIELFHRVKEIENVYVGVGDCEHLRTLGAGIVSYWSAKFAQKLGRDFEQLFEAFGWPLRLKTAIPTLETHEKLRRAITSFARVNAKPVRDSTNELEETPNSKFDPILPVQVLMAPLKRRFRFHFLSDKPTSESSKPEWYFSQVKQWVFDLVPFVKTHLEQITVSEMGISCIIEFVRCVSDMLILKVDAHLQDDFRDGVFVKILEESIAFENEIGDFVAECVDSQSKSYLPAFVNAVFSRPETLQRWVQAEKLASLEKLDDMFSSESAWSKPIAAGPPEIVDLFVAVIRSLTDRFAHLQHRAQRLKFLHLLNDLLDEFHVRSLQTWKCKSDINEYLPNDTPIDYVIADALYSIHDTLQEWEYLPFFASMSVRNPNEDIISNAAIYATAMDLSPRRQSSSSTNFVPMISYGSDSAPESPDFQPGNLFENACGLYWCLANEIQTKWCTQVIRRVKEDIHKYAQIKWQSFDCTTTPERLTDQLFPALQTLKDTWKTLFNSMDPKNADKWMKKLAVKVDEAST